MYLLFIHFVKIKAWIRRCEASERLTETDGPWSYSQRTLKHSVTMYPCKRSSESTGFAPGIERKERFSEAPKAGRRSWRYSLPPSRVGNNVSFEPQRSLHLARIAPSTAHRSREDLQLLVSLLISRSSSSACKQRLDGRSRQQIGAAHAQDCLALADQVRQSSALR